MMERTGTAMPGMPMTGMPMPGSERRDDGRPGAAVARHEHDDGAPLHHDLREVPRRHEGHCACEDKVSAAMLQNLCTMMAGGMLSCCCMMNGMMVCCYNMTMAQCKCEPTEDGVCITCTSGDPACCAMIEACCASMTRHDEGRLHLLHDDEQHAGLLRLLSTATNDRRRPRASSGPRAELGQGAARIRPRRGPRPDRRAGRRRPRSRR